MDLRETGLEDVDWIHVAHDRDRWRALVNTIISLRFPVEGGEFLASQGLYYMEIVISYL
jgi:hypothetical protein